MDFISSLFKSPKRKRSVKKSRKKYGKILLTKDNEFFKKIHHPNTKKYLTMDNGRREYLVYVGKNEIFIYKTDDKYYVPKENSEKIWTYIKFVKSYKTLKTFIGNKDGNTILVKIAKNRYVFIGRHLYEFSTTDDIIKYYSPIVSNNIPYPVGIGKTNAYFMLDKTYIPLEKFGKLTKDMKINLYNYYYGFDANFDKIDMKYEIYNEKMNSVINI